MKRLAVIAGCVVVAGVVLAFTFVRASDEDRIRDALAAFAAIVKVKEDDTLLSRTGRIRSKLKDVVTEDVRMNVADLAVDVRGRRKLEDDAARVGALYQRADCEFTNVRIRVDPAATLANVDAVAVVTAMRGGERQVDRRDVHVLLRKDGEWRIDSLDVAPKAPAP